MREYEPIWHRLKKLDPKVAECQGITVICNRLFHARIVKAVGKEKWKDVGYKLLLDPKWAVLSHSSEGSKLVFYLRICEVPKTIRCEDL